MHLLNDQADANRDLRPVCSVQYGVGLPKPFPQTKAEAVDMVKTNLASEGITDVTEVFDAVL